MAAKMNPHTKIRIVLRADSIAALLSILERGEVAHPVDAELIAQEIRNCLANPEPLAYADVGINVRSAPKPQMGKK